MSRAASWMLKWHLRIALAGFAGWAVAIAYAWTAADRLDRAVRR